MRRLKPAASSLILLASLIATSLPASVGACDGALEVGFCPEAEIAGDAVDVTASDTTHHDAASPHTTDNITPRHPATEPDPAPADPTADVLRDRASYGITAPPDLTLEDIATFRPNPTTLTGEPAGIAIAGLPTNITAPASTHEQTGTVLGWPVTIRFTPTAYTFDYGDGTHTTTPTGGTTWATLRLPQFTPTPTTHTYRHRGTYTATATIRYTAAANFGSGNWHPIPGTLTIPTNAYPITVLEAHTALVQHTCDENPRGPGC